MFDDSRIDIYDYLYSLVYGIVTNNVYRMTEPTEATETDTNEGFVVINVGELNNDSEFGRDAYGWARCYITAYVPKKSRGRLNKPLYKEYEDSINLVVNYAIENPTNQAYYIQEDSVLSTDINENAQQGNQFHTFIKSFVVVIDNVLN